MTRKEKKEMCLRCVHCIYYTRTGQTFCDVSNKYIVFCNDAWKFQEKMLNSNQKVISTIV